MYRSLRLDSDLTLGLDAGRSYSISRTEYNLGLFS